MKHPTTRLCIQVLGLASCLLAGCQSAFIGPYGRGFEPPELIGPMVGAVTPNTAELWMYTGKTTELELLYFSEGDSGRSRGSIRVVPSAEDHLVARAVLTDLRPATTYYYTIRVEGRTDARWRGRFRTAPPENRPGRIRVAVSSCMDAEKYPIQSSWYLMLGEMPAFHLLLGDNVYADTTDREVLWRKHIRQRLVEEFAAVIRNVPTYAIWDDHDYGRNDSDGTEPGKAESLRAFREVFANPAYGTEDLPGAFFKFGWADVDFFVLDTRYYRSPNKAPDDENKTMLGEGQFQWLVEGLKASRARFKVVATGSTLKQSAKDGWRLYSFERKRLYRSIMENGVEGVFFLSGDIHRCLIDVHGRDETGGYPIYEVISSGIANSEARGFVTLDFDTRKEDPTVEVRIINGNATASTSRTIRLSELR